MEDSSTESISYLVSLERVSQDKRARTLISCCLEIGGKIFRH
jgi:hypothetical protein